MSTIEIKQKLEEIIDTLPKSKLEVILDFASYLKEREQTEDFLRMQMTSKAYQEWLNSENDIYDEVFSDEAKKR